MHLKYQHQLTSMGYEMLVSTINCVDVPASLLVENIEVFLNH